MKNYIKIITLIITGFMSKLNGENNYSIQGVFS